MMVDRASIAPAGARFESGPDGIGRIVIDRPTDTVNAVSYTHLTLPTKRIV